MRKCWPGTSLKEMYTAAQKELDRDKMAEWTAASKEEKSIAAVQKFNEELGLLGHDIVRAAVHWPQLGGKEERRGFFKTCKKCRRDAKEITSKSKKDTKKGAGPEVCTGGKDIEEERPTPNW